uniref:Putative P-loop containing nucleoside triphosphate hydrolase n=1 Tax=Helianthus annuus TaxID=4232 RepID=A0A251UNM4_HELAN
MVKVMWFEPSHEHLPLANTTTGVPCRRTNTIGVSCCCRTNTTTRVPCRRTNTTSVPCHRTNTTGVPCSRTNTIGIPSHSPEHIQRSPSVLRLGDSFYVRLLQSGINFGALAAQRSSNLRFSYKSASRRVRMENNHHSDARGALIVLEGLDRSGKTSQSGRLVAYLNGLGHPVESESWRFPDRDTAVGKMISAYLSNESQLDDHIIHLLFSANRWEKRSLMEAKLH